MPAWPLDAGDVSVHVDGRRPGTEQPNTGKRLPHSACSRPPDAASQPEATVTPTDPRQRSRPDRYPARNVSAGNRPLNHCERRVANTGECQGTPIPPCTAKPPRTCRALIRPGSQNPCGRSTGINITSHPEPATIGCAIGNSICEPFRQQSPQTTCTPTDNG